MNEIFSKTFNRVSHSSSVSGHCWVVGSVSRVGTINVEGESKRKDLSGKARHSGAILAAILASLLGR